MNSPFFRFVERRVVALLPSYCLQRRKNFFQVGTSFDKAGRQLHEPFKDNPLESANE